MDLSNFKYQHNFVSDVIFDILRWVRVSMEKKMHVNFLTDPHEGRLTFRSVDVRVYEWVEEKHEKSCSKNIFSYHLSFNTFDFLALETKWISYLCIVILYLLINRYSF